MTIDETFDVASIPTTDETMFVDFMLLSMPDLDDTFLMVDRVIAKFLPPFIIDVRLVK